MKKRHRKHLNKLRRRYAEAKENIIRYGKQLNYPVEAITDFNSLLRNPRRSLSDTPFISTEPNELVRPIHNRMPVILGREDEEQWLDAFRTPFAKARSLLKSLLAEVISPPAMICQVRGVKYLDSMR